MPKCVPTVIYMHILFDEQAIYVRNIKIENSLLDDVRKQNGDTIWLYCLTAEPGAGTGAEDKVSTIQRTTIKDVENGLLNWH